MAYVAIFFCAWNPTTAFIEVEKSLREIAQREATWGAMLGNGQTPSSSSERASGDDAEVTSINGGMGVKGLPRGGGVAGGSGRLMSVGTSNGKSGSIRTDTRTLV